MKNNTRKLSQDEKYKILERDGYVCAYCLGDATEVDHVLPWNWNHNDDDDNLVACCRDCNAIANDKIFESREEKYVYINSVRSGKKWQKKFRSRVSICIRCKKTYKPRINGATMFLCSECVKYAWGE
jgi:hypothetical protein